MGIAAYNRGSKALSAEIDRDVAASDSAPVNRKAYKQLESQLEIVEHARDAAQAKLAEAEGVITRMTAEAAGLVVARNELADQLSCERSKLRFQRTLWRAARARADMMGARWRWVSSIVRCCVSPERVAEFRDEPITRDVEKVNRRVEGKMCENNESKSTETETIATLRQECATLKEQLQSAQKEVEDCRRMMAEAANMLSASVEGQS